MADETGYAKKTTDFGGREKEEVGSPAGGSQSRGMQITRAVAGAWLLGSVVLAWLSSSPGGWALILAPTWIGALLPLIRNQNLTNRVERLEEKLLARHARAREKAGKLARYFTRPLYGGSVLIWRKTQPVTDTHLRAGMRVAAVLYFASLMIALLVFVGYIVVGVVIVVAMVLFAIWVLTGGLTEKLKGPSRGYSGEPQRRAKVSRPATDLLGDPKIEHFDDSGKKIGETRPGRDFLGSPIEEHFDQGGRKIGESRPGTDLVGDPKMEHFDRGGEKTGESRPTEDFLGSPKVEHFDEKGKKTGEGQLDKDLVGDSIIRHEGKG